MYLNKYLFTLHLEKLPIINGTPKWEKEIKEKLPVIHFIYTSAFWHATEHHNFT